MTALIVFSHLRWGFVCQRPQHLMSALAERLPVLFVEEPVHTPGAPHLECRTLGPNLQVLVPHTPLRAVGFHDEQLPTLRSFTSVLLMTKTPELALLAPSEPQSIIVLFDVLAVCRMTLPMT